MKSQLLFGVPALAAGLFVALGAFAGEDDIHLAAGPGVEVVEVNCSACHSLDYIVMNSPIFDEAGWKGSVTKMVNAFGAPITTEDQATIVTYLAAHYGK